MIKNRSIIIIFSFLLFVSLALAETKKFEGKGAGPIESNDIRVARAMAIKRGAKAALEEAVASMLNPKVFQDKYSTLEKNIFSAQEKYVTGSSVLSESRAGKNYEVIVAANINMTALRASLTQIGLLTPLEKMPKWIVVIPESVDDGAAQSAWLNANTSVAETEIESLLKKYGYNVIKPKENIALPAEAAQNPLDHLPEIQNAAKQFGATHIIVGVSEFHKSGGVTRKENSLGKAVLSLRAISVVDGAEVGRLDGSFTMELPDSQNAAKLVITGEIVNMRADVEGWLDKVNPDGATGFNEVSLRLTGFVSYADYAAIIEALEKNIPGVRGVVLTALSRGEAEVRVRYFGDGAELAKQLVGYQFNGFVLEKAPDENGKTILKVIPKPEQ